MARTSEDWQMLIIEMERKMAYMENMNIEGRMKNTDARMANIEVTMASLASSGLHEEDRADKNKFFKEVLESKAISNIGKLSTPSEYRIWSKNFKNAYEQVLLYA